MIFLGWEKTCYCDTNKARDNVKKVIKEVKTLFYTRSMSQNSKKEKNKLSLSIVLKEQVYAVN